MFKRNIYLENLSLEEALERWRSKLEQHGIPRLKYEQIAVDDALGRVTAEALFARRSAPFYNAAAMDGIAVRFQDTYGASEHNPIRLRAEQYVPVNTGNAVPDQFDAVIMIEDTHPVESECVEITKAVPPWQHIRPIGEDIVATELVIPEGHCIRPIDQGALLAAGITEIKVYQRPKICVIPTGSELVQPDFEHPAPGNIIEFNSRILAGYVQQWQAQADRHPTVPDEPDALKKAIGEASARYDLVLINAGASAGSKDYTSSILEDLCEVVVHGVSIKPGKPVILALIDDTPVVGLPGYPVSAVITEHLFVRDLIYAMQGMTPPVIPKTKALLSRPISSKLGMTDFVRVKLGVVGEKPIATPVSRGAGVVMSMVRADGILTVPAGSEGAGAGETVDIELLREFDDIRNTLVFIGSHDNLLDVLANILHKQRPICFLSSAHVGSLGGIMAIKRKEAHLAGTHLIDEASGEYNIPFIQKHLPGIPLRLINLAYREQGLLVQKGNPKKITDFTDLCRDDVLFINRQRGAGTRILTDLYLKEKHIDSDMVKGYDRQEYTHMNIASAVAAGTADTGVAIRAAAQALGLDFVPVAKERYDLIVPEEHFEDEKITRLLEIIRTDSEFQQTVSRLGGYDLKDSGKVVYQQ